MIIRIQLLGWAEQWGVKNHLGGFASVLSRKKMSEIKEAKKSNSGSRLQKKPVTGGLSSA